MCFKGGVLHAIIGELCTQNISYTYNTMNTLDNQTQIKTNIRLTFLTIDEDNKRLLVPPL